MFFGSDARKYKEEADLLKVERDILAAELALYKEIAAISDNEALIVLNENKEAIFFNTKAEAISDKKAVNAALATHGGYTIPAPMPGIF